MIIVEDGTGVAGANSYVSPEELEQYARLRGIALTGDREEITALLIKAMDYLETYDGRFIGERVRHDQALSWPRWNGTRMVPPHTLKKVQMILALAAREVDLMPSVSASTAFTTRKTVGPITVEQVESTRTGRATVPEADALLGSLLKYQGQLRVVRT